MLYRYYRMQSNGNNPQPNLYLATARTILEIHQAWNLHAFEKFQQSDNNVREVALAEPKRFVYLTPTYQV